MRKSLMNRGLSFILSLVLAYSIFPATTFAQNYVSTDEISGYSEDKGYEYIYLGIKENQPVKWRILSGGGSTIGGNDYLLDDSGERIANNKAYFILADSILDFTGALSTWDNYQESMLKEWCMGLLQDDFQTGIFSEIEKKALLNTTKDDEEITVGNTTVLGAIAALI